MLAATVCPTSTLREITMPSMGEVIIVWPRFTFAWFNEASAWVICAREERNCASANRASTCAASSSLAGIRLRAERPLARASFVSASSMAIVRRSTSACARIRLALDCSTCVSNNEGSSRAITSSALTIELKSA